MSVTGSILRTCPARTVRASGARVVPQPPYLVTASSLWASRDLLRNGRSGHTQLPQASCADCSAGGTESAIYDESCLPSSRLSLERPAR